MRQLVAVLILIVLYVVLVGSRFNPSDGDKLAAVSRLVVAKDILAKKDKNYGFDARAGEYGDLLDKGIIDPTKVVRCALQNAASVATLLLTSDALIADQPKDEGKKGAAGGGYDDMY